jgi:hypothetical protein
VTIKNVVFCDEAPCGCHKNQRFGGTYRTISGTGISELRTILLDTAKAVCSSLFLFNMMMEAISSYETLVLTRVTRRRISENGIFTFILDFSLRLEAKFDTNKQGRIKNYRLKDTATIKLKLN